MGQFIIDNDDSTSGYDSYYQPQEKKSKNKIFIILLAVIALIAVILWTSGVFKPKDDTVSYKDTIDNICDLSITYISDSDNQSNLVGIDVPGKIIYIELKDLVKADLIGSSIINPLTNTKFSLNTDIMLKVVSKNNFTCEGLVYDDDDRESPVVTLIGDPIVTVSVGGTYLDPGAVAEDNRDGNIDENVRRSGTVNFEVPGTYTISYFAIDRAGNYSNVVTRNIIVQ